MEERRKIKSRIIFLCFFIALTAVAAGLWKDWKERNTGNGENAFAGPEGMRDSRTEFVTASAVTMTGMDRIAFELDTEDIQLVVEEVYVSSGEEVEKGSKILKLTQDSVEEAHRELSHAAVEAQLHYRQGLLDYELAVIEAKKTRDSSLLESEYAQADYDMVLAEAQKEIDQLEEERKEAEELYQEYYDGINNDSYEIEYELEDKKALYETNEALYWSTLKKWNLDDSQINNSSGGTETAAGTQQGDRGGSSTQDISQVTALELLEDTYRANRDAYEQALEECSKAKETAQAGIEKAQAEYELRSLQLEQAKIDYEKKAAAGKADYETALAQGAIAESIYQTELKSKQKELDVLADAKEETAENLALFESYLEDGYLYTDNRGTIMAVMVSKGQSLETDDIIMAYSNRDLVTVSASVDQSDIASISVGDNAVAVSQEYGALEGTVTQLNPISDSGGRANVTYSVEVTLEAGETEIEANRTVTLYFGMDLEEYEAMAERQPGVEEGMERERTTGQERTNGEPSTDRIPRAGVMTGSEASVPSDSGEGGR